MVLHSLILKLMVLPRDRMTFSYKTLICDLGTSSVSLPLCKLSNTFALDIPDNSDSSLPSPLGIYLSFSMSESLQTKFSCFVFTNTTNLPPTCFSSLFLYLAESFLGEGRSRKCSKCSSLAESHFWSLILHEQFGWETQLGIPADVKFCASGLGFCFLCLGVNSWDPLWN